MTPIWFSMTSVTPIWPSMIYVTQIWPRMTPCESKWHIWPSMNHNHFPMTQSNPHWPLVTSMTPKWPLHDPNDPPVTLTFLAALLVFGRWLWRRPACGCGGGAAFPQAAEVERDEVPHHERLQDADPAQTDDSGGQTKTFSKPVLRDHPLRRPLLRYKTIFL